MNLINNYDYKITKWDSWVTDTEPQTLDDYFPLYSYTTKIDGQTVEVEFESFEPYTHRGIRHWNIGLTIGSKRKNFSSYHQKKETTGKIGIQGLLFAKAAIQHFEENWCEKGEDAIYAHWLDNRRRNVYEFGLKKLGFDYKMFNGKKVLYKEII